MSTNVNGETTDPLIGQTISNGKYVIVKVLGEGGMGKVYQGEQKLGDGKRQIAIKTLQPELAQDPQLVARFEREAGTVAQLEHPNTIRFYDSGKLEDGKLYVVMEFIQGESLAHVIARGPLPPQKVEHILAQACGSLGEAHEHGVIHRDIKPENIILTQKGSKGDFVKVLDFGIAKRDEGAEDAAHAKLTRQGMVLGTPPYMSPEQFTGQPLKPMSDIYSLAIVAYEMLTGQLPFQASTPWEWATKHLTTPPLPFESHIGGANIPPRHKAAVLRALSKRAEERPQTMQQFLQEFTGNASVGNDWSQATNSGPSGFGPMQGSMQGSMQGGGMFTPSAVPHMSTPQPGNMTAPAGSGGIAATMAVNYPQATPQPFHATPNPNGGFAPANTGPGFPAVNQPPSNPGFHSMQQQQPQYGGYASSQQGYGQTSHAPPSGSNPGKFIAIGVAVLLLCGVIAGVAVSASNNNNGDSNTGNNNNTGNIAQQPQPVAQPNLPVAGNNGLQPVNNTARCSPSRPTRVCSPSRPIRACSPSRPTRVCSPSRRPRRRRGPPSTPPAAAARVASTSSFSPATAARRRRRIPPCVAPAACPAASTRASARPASTPDRRAPAVLRAPSHRFTQPCDARPARPDTSVARAPKRDGALTARGLGVLSVRQFEMVPSPGVPQRCNPSRNAAPLRPARDGGDGVCLRPAMAPWRCEAPCTATQP